MPITKKCYRCDGNRGHYVLVSAHDDEKEFVICEKCKGEGVIHYMTEEEERDYKENNGKYD